MTGPEYLIQAAMIDVLQGPTVNFMANLTNSATLLDFIHTKQASEETVTSWMMAAKIFAATFGYIYAGLQVLVYAIGPILLLIMLLPGMGISVFSSYLQLLAWFPMTLILLSITNNILTSWTQHSIVSVWDHYHGLTIIGKGFISSQAAKMVEVGAWLNSIVPMLAWALISKGSVAIDDILATNKSLDFVTQASSRITSGEISLNNQSISNVTANSFDTAMRTDMGALPVSMNMLGAATNAMANLGGRSFMQNNSLATNNALTTKIVSTESYGEDLLTTAYQNTYANNRNLIQSSNSTVESVTGMITSIESHARGGLVSGIATYLLQQKLAHDYGLTQQDATSVAKQLATATVASANAAKSDMLGEKDKSRNYTQMASKELGNAYQYLADKLGASTSGKVAAGVLIAAGLSGAALVMAPAEVTAGVAAGAKILGRHIKNAFGMASESAGVNPEAASAILRAGVTDWEAGNSSVIKLSEPVVTKQKLSAGNKIIAREKYAALTGFTSALKEGISGGLDRNFIFTHSASHINSDIINKEDFASSEERALQQNNIGTLLRSTTTTTVESVLPKANPTYSQIFHGSSESNDLEIAPINLAKMKMNDLKKRQFAENKVINRKVRQQQHAVESKF